MSELLWPQQGDHEIDPDTYGDHASQDVFEAHTSLQNLALCSGRSLQQLQAVDKGDEHDECCGGDSQEHDIRQNTWHALFLTRPHNTPAG